METSTPHSSETSQVMTKKLCTFDKIRKAKTCAEFGWNPPARSRSTYTWNIQFLWLLPAILPYCLFSCAPAQAKRIELISRIMAQKTQFGVRKCLPASFFSILTFFWVILPQTPNFLPPLGKSQPNKKSRITSKPFKIDKKCQLNMNIKSG